MGKNIFNFIKEDLFKDDKLNELESFYLLSMINYGNDIIFR